MNIQIIEDIDKIDLYKWRSFVMRHTKGSVFQSPEMYKCYTKVPHQHPFVFVAYQNEEIVGVLLGVKMEEKGKLKSLFSKRSIIYSGPIIENENTIILKILLNAYEQRLRKKVIYTQIRNQFENLKNCDIYHEYGYVFESHLNFLVHIDREEIMWERMGKGRTKQIKKAIKNKLYVQAYVNGDISSSLLKEGFLVIQEVYKRANLPLADYSLFEAANEQGLLVLFIVRTDKGEIAGCRFALRFGITLYGWYAGSYSKFYSLFPNDILIWETLKWSLHNNIKVFDYGGAGSPNELYGVRNFKQQVGGELVNYGRYTKIHKPIIYAVSKCGYYVFRKLFHF